MSEKNYPLALEELIDILKTLPGVGKRSAERMAFSMLKWQDGKLAALSENVKTLKERVTECPECRNFASEGALCPVCSSHSREKSVICVVEEPSQIINIEKSSFFKGLYHVLGGKLAPLEGKGLEDLNIKQLLKRIESTEVNEVIIALSPDVEGQATAVYLANILKDKNLKVTRLAQGLPAGSDISYADSATIAAAMNGRISL